MSIIYLRINKVLNPSHHLVKRDFYQGTDRRRGRGAGHLIRTGVQLNRIGAAFEARAGARNHMKSHRILYPFERYENIYDLLIFLI